MAFGCFMDIYQQNGIPQRMHYEGMTPDVISTVRWIGIQEETAQNFKSCEYLGGETHE